MRAIVVGGGAYGLACAATLARAGADVTLLERDTPAHPRQASGGLTRILRFEYGERERYTELTVRALEVWRALEREHGVRLFEPKGMLHLAAGEGAWEHASYERILAAGLPGELLSPAEVRARWPVLSLDGVSFALWSPAGGFLWARRATEALGARARQAGVAIRTGAVAAIDGPGRVRVGDETLTADVVVLCAGSWSGQVDARLGVVVPRRQVSAYVERPVGGLPALGDGGLDFYGVPAPDGSGVKVGWHRTRDGPVADPADVAARTVTASDLEPLERFLERRLPAIAGAPLVEGDVCFYAMTADEHPIVDWLDERTLACTGLSGHGFKFAPVLAAAAADVALGRDPAVPLEGFERDRPALRAPRTLS